MIEIRNKKGFMSPLLVIFIDIAAVILWAMFAAEQFNYWGTYVIQINNLTGVEAFLWSNLNLWLFLALVLFNLAAFYFGE